MSVTVIFSNNQIRAAAQYIFEHNPHLNRTPIELYEMIERMMFDMVKGNNVYVSTGGFTILSTDEYDDERGNHCIVVEVLVDPLIDSPRDYTKSRV